MTGKDNDNIAAPCVVQLTGDKKCQALACMSNLIQNFMCSNNIIIFLERAKYCQRTYVQIAIYSTVQYPCASNAGRLKNKPSTC